MKKKLLYLALGALVATTSCSKKKDTATNTTPTTTSSTTSSTTSGTNAEPKLVQDSETGYEDVTVEKQQEALAVDMTATWCHYCGQWGMEEFKKALALNPKRVNGLSAHWSNSGDNLYTKTSQEIYTKMYTNSGGTPNVGEGEVNYVTSPQAFQNAVKAKIAKTDPSAAIGMATTYDGDNVEVRVKTEFYAKTGLNKYYLQLFVTEDNVKDHQIVHQDPPASNLDVNPFYHDHVIRTKVGGPDTDYRGVLLYDCVKNGALLTDSKLNRKYTISLDPTWDKTKLHIVAVLFKMSPDGSKVLEVLNSQTVK